MFSVLADSEDVFRPRRRTWRVTRLERSCIVAFLALNFHEFVVHVDKNGGRWRCNVLKAKLGRAVGLVCKPPASTQRFVRHERLQDERNAAKINSRSWGNRFSYRERNEMGEAVLLQDYCRGNTGGASTTVFRQQPKLLSFRPYSSRVTCFRSGCTRGRGRPRVFYWCFRSKCLCQLA